MSVAQRVGGEDHRGGGVRRVLDRPVDVVGEDVAGPVAAARCRAGAACRRTAAARARGRPARRAPSPARRSRRRSPTGWCRRSGCRGRARRSRPTRASSSARAAVAADGAAEHRVVPVHRERRLVQEQVAVLAQRVAEPAAGELPLGLRLVEQLGERDAGAQATGRCSRSPASSASALTAPGGRRPTPATSAMPPNGSCIADDPVEGPAHGRPVAAHERRGRGGPASGARRRPRGTPTCWSRRCGPRPRRRRSSSATSRRRAAVVEAPLGTHARPPRPGRRRAAPSRPRRGSRRRCARRRSTGRRRRAPAWRRSTRRSPRPASTVRSPSTCGIVRLHRGHGLPEVEHHALADQRVEHACSATWSGPWAAS